MARALLVLSSDPIREKAKRWIDGLPDWSRIEFKPPRRTLTQNDFMWALLTDVSQQLTWHGKRLSPDNWKLVFMSGLKHELQIIPNFHGDGFIPIGFSSSDLGKEEFSDLIELIQAYGAEKGVVFHAPAEAA